MQVDGAGDWDDLVQKVREAREGPVPSGRNEVADSDDTDADSGKTAWASGPWSSGRTSSSTSAKEMRKIAAIATDGSWSWDDVKGENLKPERVMKARMEEIEHMQEKGIWREVDEEECWKMTGKAPVTVKWVDTSKGSDSEPFERCRIAARDFKERGDNDRQDLFAATPPLEMKRMLMSKAATIPKNGKARKLLFIGAKKAHVNTLSGQDVLFALPREAEAKPGRCGKLVHWLYGFRPAAQAWENHYSNKLMPEGFVRGPGASVAFVHRERDLACVVHCDDFTFCGPDSDLTWIQNKMTEWYGIKVRGRLGPDRG